MGDSDSSSLSSALSSAPPSDDDRVKLAPIFTKPKKKPAAKKAAKKTPEPPPSPPRPPRSPSPPHAETLADNPDIAVLVMFRSRFAAAFPPKTPHYGPQDIERGVGGPDASPQAEDLLCALLALVLNRKKPVERGHHGRALEEAIASQRGQWPRNWNGVNPLHGARSFNTMTPDERLNLLRTLAVWSLTSSEIVSQMIRESYKQSRHEDDLNQPLSVQPWGQDGDKRRYWLVEGQDDTNFRLYRESAKASTHTTWWSMAGSIEEITGIADRLETKDTTQAARRLANRIRAAVPRFEATEEKRKRREYRQMRRAQFARPEPGFSLYEGRTRGKRLRYTFDDDEFDESDTNSARRSGRHSDRSTPAEPRGPIVTASGRQVKTREGGMYGETLLSGQIANTDSAVNGHPDVAGSSGAPGRPSRFTTRVRGYEAPQKRKHIDTFNEVDETSEEDDAASTGGWNSADNEDEEDGLDGGLSDESDLEDDATHSLVVKLKVPSLARTGRESPVDHAMADAPLHDGIHEALAKVNGKERHEEDAARLIKSEDNGLAVPSPASCHAKDNGTALRESWASSLDDRKPAPTTNGYGHQHPLIPPMEAIADTAGQVHLEKGVDQQRQERVHVSTHS